MVGRNQIDKGFDGGIEHLGTYNQSKTKNTNQPFDQADLQIKSEYNNQNSHNNMNHHINFSTENHTDSSESVSKTLDAFFHYTLTLST